MSMKLREIATQALNEMKDAVKPAFANRLHGGAYYIEGMWYRHVRGKSSELTPKEAEAIVKATYRKPRKSSLSSDNIEWTCEDPNAPEGQKQVSVAMYLNGTLRVAYKKSHLL